MSSPEEARSPASLSRGGALRSAKSGQLRPTKADLMDVDTPASPAAGRRTAGALGHGIPAVHSGEIPSPSKPHLHLPPVQVSGNSATHSHGGPISPVAMLTSPTTGTSGASGRRNSTPAALDMALRTAEGRQALEHLIQTAGNKQMMFGQYFGGPGGSPTSGTATATAPRSPGAGSPNAAAAAAAAAAAGAGSRFGKAAVLPNAVPTSPHSKGSASPASHTHPAHPPPPYPGGASFTNATAHMHAMDARPASVQAAPPLLPHAHAHHAAHAHAHAGPGHAPSQPPAVAAAFGARPVATPQKRPAEVPVPQLAAAHGKPPTQLAPGAAAQTAAAHAAAAAADEVPPARPTRILSLATQLPVGMARKYWSLSDYSIVRKMYTGYASTVYQATCRRSLEQVALKVYHMENLCELNHYQVFREVRVHSSLTHEHIIALFCAFQEGNDVVLVQEYAEGGDLYRLLHRNGGRLSERQAVEMVLHPFLLALHYLHTRGIMHRDIKPENVLFTDQRVLKLADFGLAIDLTEERAVTRAGTLDYMAPEVLRCPPKNLPQENKNNASLHYNNSVDAWAVGVFAFELIVGYPPFAGESQLASVDKIIHATPEFPDKMSELAKAFIVAALKKQPADRPSVLEMLHHSWIRSYQRRVSVRMPPAMRRRSSVQHHGTSLAPAPEEGSPNMDEMTPEEIEVMIQRLQMAKHAADVTGL